MTNTNIITIICMRRLLQGPESGAVGACMLPHLLEDWWCELLCWWWWWWWWWCLEPVPLEDFCFSCDCFSLVDLSEDFLLEDFPSDGGCKLLDRLQKDKQTLWNNYIEYKGTITTFTTIAIDILLSHLMMLLTFSKLIHHMRQTIS